MTPRSLVSLLASLLVSCASDRDASAARSGAALIVAPAVTGTTVELDRDADVTLGGLLEEAPAGADPDRVIVLRADAATLARWPGLDHRRVLDARLLAGGAVAVLDADHALRVLAQDGEELELDVDVEGPLAVAGSAIVYVRGEMPDLEVARADPSTGAVELLTRGMAPAWSPAVSADGRTVVFVSGRDGSPRLYRKVGQGRPEPLPPSARFPTAPRAPRLQGDVLEFEDELGAAAVELATGRVLPAAGDAR